MKNTVSKTGFVFALSAFMITAMMGSAAVAAPVDLVLKLKERTSIEALARSVNDPSSPRYHKFYTPAEIKTLVAPSEAEYSSLIRALKIKGFEIVRESPSHTLITVRAEHTQVENTLGTKLNRQANAFFGTQTNAKIPSELSLVESITGLDQTKRLRPRYRFKSLRPEELAANTASSETENDADELSPESKRKKKPSPKPKPTPKPPKPTPTPKPTPKPTPTPTPVPTPVPGSGPTDGSVSQSDIKTNYGFDGIYSSGVTGNGQDIAIATYDGFHIEDVNGFFVQSNISPAPVVDQVTFNGTPAINEDSAVETSLDAEFSGMIAPGAKIHVFASAENSDAGELAMFTAILDDNRAKVINYSWGMCETNVAPAHRADMDKVYARAVAQGVNILVASGDSGSDGCGNGGTVAGWPATQPNAVAVGGTTYGVDGSGKLAETAWNGSGGGVSSLYDLPAYQSNFQSPFSKRSIPDVAFDANNSPGQDVWTSCIPNQATGSCTHGAPHWMAIGGTSMAAPQWSGFLALVGEARAKASKPTLGFLNPIVYALSSSDRAKTFHDVTSGSNGTYSAGAGWDATTGWGSMQADALLNYLTQQ